jgi:translation initiation factor 3 subunit A
MLRSHLTSHAKHAHLSHTIDLNDPDTLQRHLDTRFTQLNVAAKLEHWCEGFRSVEDIFQLIEVSHKAPKAYMMASYYKHLSKILMVGDNFLFHAAAYSGYFTIMRQNKNLAQEEFDLMANLCLISALAIPIIKLGSRGASDHDEKVKNHKLTFLLRASKVPTREALLKDALSFSPNISADALELYKILESRFHPLQICQKIAPIMERFTKDSYLSGYVKPLHQVVLSRLLKQLSQVYTTIKIESVVSLAMFPAPYKYSSHDIEKIVMQGCKRGEFFIRIHHSTQTLNFECNDEGNPTINALSRNVFLFSY